FLASLYDFPVRDVLLVSCFYHRRVIGKTTGKLLYGNCEATQVCLELSNKDLVLNAIPVPKETDCVCTAVEGRGGGMDGRSFLLLPMSASTYTNVTGINLIGKSHVKWHLQSCSVVSLVKTLKSKPFFVNNHEF